jgi:RHS repeat-associated protein
LPTLSADQKQESIAYFDGLGRPIQSVIWQGSPTKTDIVQPFIYDNLGRNPLNYLAYTGGTNGWYKTDALPQLNTFYLPGNTSAFTDGRATTAKPFAETRFEASPLNRVLEQGAPGESWQIINPGATTNKTIKQAQRTNTSTEVRQFTYTFASDPNLYGLVSSTKYCEAGQLFVSEIKDEHNNLTVGYTDKLGQIILKKVQFQGGSTPTSADFLYTYYIYDDLGNLRMVIQPEGVATIPATGSFVPNASFITNWCFTYHYDARGRIIEKSVPGAGKTSFVYGKRDELLLSQDARQNAVNQWSFTKYDAFGRAVLTGIYRPTVKKDRVGVQSDADAFTAPSAGNHFEDRLNTSVNGYTLDHTFPAIDATRDQLLSVNFYDDYIFGSNTVAAYASPGGTFNTTASTQTRGLATGTRVRILGENNWLTTVMYYDKYGRVIQVRAGNHVGGADVVSSRYDFAGRVLETRQQHATPGKQVAVSKSFTYDHAGRLLTEKMQVDATPAVLVASYRYNELGEVVEKKLHSTDQGQTFLQTVDYRYTIRGWLKKINDPAHLDPTKLFGFELLYDELFPVSNHKAQYNGNISAIKWKSNRESSIPIRGYGFKYDPANRLTGATYRAGADWSEEPDSYSLTSLNYSKNGNIKTLRQNGLVQGSIEQMDNLQYTYSGNQLIGVDDQTSLQDPLAGDFFDKGGSKYSASNKEYAYDLNGNLTADKNKGITSITYNYLNLPEKILINGGEIRNTYTASGQKLTTRIYPTSGGAVSKTIQYIGGFVYESSAATGQVSQLSFFPHSEGRVRLVDNKYRYEYDYKDHLGNVRMSYAYFDPHTESTTLTMEPANEAREVGEAYPKFQNMRADMRSSTEKYEQSFSAKLNAMDGPSIRVPVQKGDKVKASTYYKFYSAQQLQQQANQDATTSPAVNYPLLGTTPGVPAPNTNSSEAKKKEPSVSLNLLAVVPLVKALTGAKAQSEDAQTQALAATTLPDAFILFEVFDEKGDFLRSKKVPVSVSDGWSILNGEELTTTEKGTIHVQLINNTARDVWFDFFNITVERAAGVRVIQEDHYYPFGLTMNGLSYRKDEKIINQFQYNGKEKREELGLNWLDYGARMYDPQLGRWHSVDPKANQFLNQAPYAYAGNNPVANIDPDGQAHTLGSQMWTQDKLRQGGDKYFYRLGLQTGQAWAVQQYRFEQIGKQAAADFRKNDLWSKYHRYYDDARSPGPFESMAATLGGLLVPAIPSLAMAIHGARSGNYGEFAVGLLGFGLGVAGLGGNYVRTASTADHAAVGAIQYGSADDQYLINAAKATQREGVLNVAVHGSPTSVDIGQYTVNWRVLAGLIERNPQFNKQPIELLSCNTGVLPNGFAQNLANKLGVNVRAPDNFIWAWPSGRMGVYPMNSVGQPMLSRAGRMIEFTPFKK